MSDAARVLRGLSLVIDRAAKRGGPEVAHKLQRISHHMSGLMQSFINNQQQEEAREQNSNTGSNQSAGNGINVQSPPKDVIGFDSLNEEDKVTFNQPEQESTFKKMKERTVPSTQFGRFVGFGGLAMKLAIGGAVDNASAMWSGSADSQRISDQTAETLAEGLCRMRGAALKLGQMLSLQDDTSMSPALSKALERVKQAADYMPKHQLEQQLTSQLGADWKSHFKEFDYVPVAAASIGQVHKAVLMDGTSVAVKIQYPGVAQSIHSDLQNLKHIVSMANILPPGLFIDNIIKVASVELSEECDYLMEARSQTRYRDLIAKDTVLSKHVVVPAVFDKLSSERVLTTEWVPGVPIDKAAVLPQRVRNAIARTMLMLSIRELFEWKFIQSDPNFANFLYDDQSRKVYLVDFGASRQYSDEFVDGYMRLVWAAANRDRNTLLEQSIQLGFLTGDESQEFTDAHLDAGMVVGEPFLEATPFDFHTAQLTSRIGQYSGIFMKYRLTPPPTEAYSLHRKLAGSFFLCMKLKAVIPCRDILEDTFKRYKFTSTTTTSHSA